ncbi:glycoside hydrolase family 3 protein [Actinoplanes sp. NBRC 103695]|uniref:glycoside hydrolase family 3 protein n=1 Tax=Actinoplanes sp. NBRC 103695 TaxID=3032202 RepID=UPI0024A44EF2|nr:glycoside hydrolase family 3 protein [Actinoplanes sp. NBRC 103695]GLZ02232.1 beta-N-acetylhexosaminidase [Actinoplanes sp. NBRC 103695]
MRGRKMIGAVLAAALVLVAPPGVAEAQDGGVRALLRQMTVREKVGQLFVVEVYGQDAATVTPAMAARNQALYGVDTPAQVIEKYQPGGVIYFDARRGPDNVRSPRQIATLSNGLQRAALDRRVPIPLLISTDQEGGAVVYRLTAPATAMPGNMALGATRSPADARRSARVIGSELAAVGINQDYAPVADVNVNPANPVIGVRSAGSDPALVSSMVSAQITGYHAGGVATVAKHFPGHGDTAVDSHLGLPEVTHTRAQLNAIDLPPFRAAIRRGVDTIMTAHVVLRSVDPSGAPATMSRPILTGLLREDLGYDGLIVTDALDMGGATADYPPAVAPVRAFQAGADQLVLAPQMDTAFGAVLAAVESGEISRRRLDESVTRILRLKRQRGLWQPFVDPARAERVVGSAAHKADEQAITDRTITMVKKDGLPVRNGKVLVTGWGVTTTSTLGAAIGRRGSTVTVRETGATPTQAAIDAAVTASAGQDLVVVSTMNANAAQQSLVRALLATGRPVVVTAVRNPYDIGLFPEVKAYLASYGYTAASLESLTRVLFGEVDPSGRLPVAIPSLYPFGHGLSYH